MDNDRQIASTKSNNLLRDYSAIVAFVAIATLIRVAVAPLVDMRVPYVTFFLAIIFAAWLQGWRGGVVATLLSAVAVNGVILQKEHWSWRLSSGDLAAVSLFVVEGLVISALGQAQVTAQRRAERSALAAQENAAEAQRSMAIRQDSEMRHAAILNAALDCIITIDGEGRITEFNPAAEATFGYGRTEVIGSLIADTIIPPYLREQHRHGFSRYLKTGESQILGQRIEVVGMRRDGSEFPVELAIVPSSVAGRLEFTAYLRDITERKQSRQELEARVEREALVNRIERAIRTSLDPEQIQHIAVQALGEALKADRCYFSTYDGDLARIGQDYRREDLPSLAGEYNSSDFEVRAEDYYTNGQTLVIEDTYDGTFPQAIVDALRQARLRSGIGVPLYDNGRLVATLNVAMADEPRFWSAEDVALVETVATETRSAVEAARLFNQTQARAERESLLNKIGHAMRTSFLPSEIERTTTALLGLAMHVDRCYYTHFDEERLAARVGADWHRPGVPEMAGEFPQDQVVDLIAEYTRAGTIVIEDDIAGEVKHPATLEVGLRASIRVPLFSGGQLVAVFGVAMYDKPRRWTQEEIGLVEAVATQTRAAVDAARINEREHTIATQLQEALLPSIPEHVAGLTLKRFYEAALQEAGVGGDFYDVFSIDKGCTALVVGDLTGKGLAAAAQVATVRNMLRATLYTGDTLSEAITTLNHVIAEHGLLTGFATLFVGLYDSGRRTLTYVNCGQDPGLIRRAATGEIDELPPTGTVLGSFDEAIFSQKSVTLQRGDALAIFTDGLTEAGPDRQHLLGLEGVASLLEKPLPEDALSDAKKAADYLMLRLVGGVESYASAGGLGDDVCLLMAVVEE